MPSIVLNNVCYRYKNSERDALSNVSCTFAPGLVTAVIGPSGSGKTTLLSLIAGLDQPSAGTICIDGKLLSDLNPDTYRREYVSMIFQAFQLFPLLTAQENVCYPQELNGTDKRIAAERARALLSSVGIGEEKHARYPSHLSGGEQQRIAIARALSSGAKVILADEPTGNLDTENGQYVMQTLTRLAHEESYSVIIVTHDPDIAYASDQVLRMSDGILHA